jgi:hypothetical protein
MAEYHQLPPDPPDRDSSATAPLAPPGRRALLTTLAIAVGGAVLGIVGGLAWSALAPQAQFQVASRGVAYVVNPETTAFIAADAWFVAVGLVGGALIGLAAYLLGVRRLGPLPVVGALAGATAAAFLAWWTGSSIGVTGFRHQLSVARPGALIHQPVDLGAHGALAFWPLAAGIVIAGIELTGSMRDRQRRPALAAAPVPDWYQPGYAPDGGDESYSGPDGGGPGGTAQHQTARDQTDQDRTARDRTARQEPPGR